MGVSSVKPARINSPLPHPQRIAVWPAKSGSPNTAASAPLKPPSVDQAEIFPALVPDAVGRIVAAATAKGVIIPIAKTGKKNKNAVAVKSRGNAAKEEILAGIDSFRILLPKPPASKSHAPAAANKTLRLRRLRLRLSARPPREYPRLKPSMKMLMIAAQTKTVLPK